MCAACLPECAANARTTPTTLTLSTPSACPCDLQGNVYVKFATQQAAEAASRAFHGRYYSGVTPSCGYVWWGVRVRVHVCMCVRACVHVTCALSCMRLQPAWRVPAHRSLMLCSSSGKSTRCTEASAPHPGLCAPLLLVAAAGRQIVCSYQFLQPYVTYFRVQ